MKDEELRKFTYFSMLVLTQWLSGKDKVFTAKIARVAGTD